MLCGFHREQEAVLICATCATPLCADCVADSATNRCYSCNYGPSQTETLSTELLKRPLIRLLMADRKKTTAIASSLALCVVIIAAALIYAMQVKGASLRDIVLGNQAKVYYTLYELEPLDRYTLKMNMSDGRQSHQLTYTDFSSHGNYDNYPYDSPKIPTRLSGALHFDFTIQYANTEDLASAKRTTPLQGSVDIPLNPDWVWHVSFHINDFDPMDMCFGCFGSKRFDLAGETEQALWVVWGGNYIKNPVNY